MTMFYHWEDNKNHEDNILHLFLRVQPKASKDEFSEVLDDRIKLRITAPPVDGKANKHLLKFLSKIFKVSKAKITIKSGETGRNKHLIIQNPKQLPEQINEKIDAG